MLKNVWIQQLTLALSLCAAGTLAIGCGAAPDEEEDDTSATDSAIIGGATDASDPSIVAIFAHAANSSSGSLCTGTVISSRSVLTAAHCVDPRVVGANNVFEVYTGTTLNGSSQRLAVSATAFDSAFDPAKLNNGHDIAVVTLAKATTLTPIPVNKTALSSANVGASVRIVGYGASTHTNTGAGTKRTATTTIGAVGSTLLQIGSAQQTCHGDSGGPALMKIGGVETIIGVTSYGYDKTTTDVCYGGGYDTRADAYKTFIAKYL